MSGGNDLRFGFGANWRAFLSALDEDRMAIARESIRELTGLDQLAGRTFLDVGCGSGLFSLAARQMGARVLSFDYDPQSVECARELRKRFFPDDPDWDIRQGSALDAEFLGGLGRFDLVYSWGVLHHTGDMWRALAQMPRLLTERGLLVVSLYNECGLRSRFWRGVKRFYCRSPKPVRWALLLGMVGVCEGQSALLRLARGQNPLPFKLGREYRRNRGMSKWHDWVDWVGGYPFETALPGEVVEFYRRLGLRLERLKTPGPGHCCNEYVFVRREGASPCAA